MNVTPKQIKSLDLILRKVWNSNRSNFYRRKYKENGFNPLRDFKNRDDVDKIPFLVRRELVETNPDERLYVQEKKIKYIRTTSGTSGFQVIVYRPPYGKRENTTFSIIPENVERIFVSKNQSGVPAYYNLIGRDRLVYFGNRSNLNDEVKIAKQIRVDGLLVNPDTALMIAENLGRIYDLKKIKFVCLYGRKVTRGAGDLLRKLYPSATILSIYGMNEVGLLGNQCKYLANKSFNIYHTFDDVIYEVTDNSGGKNGKGELILTILRADQPTPIIRYRTGDLVQLSPPKMCPCGKKGVTLSFIGRAQFDTAQIGREFLIRSEEINKTVASLPGFIYKGRVFIKEKIVGNVAKPSLVFILYIMDRNIKLSVKQRIIEVFAKKMKLFFRHKIGTLKYPPNLFKSKKMGYIFDWRVDFKFIDRDIEDKRTIIDCR